VGIQEHANDETILLDGGWNEPYSHYLGSGRRVVESTNQLKGCLPPSSSGKRIQREVALSTECFSSQDPRISLTGF